MDRYVKDEINILSVQFSPDGRLLATGASDNQIRVRSLQWHFHTVSTSTLFRFGI